MTRCATLGSIGRQLPHASVTGWAVGSPDSSPTFGTLRFAKPVSPHALVYREMRSWLDAWIRREGRPDLIVYESPVNAMKVLGRSKTKTLRVLTGLCEHVEELCLDRAELREAATSDVRAHFIGTNPSERKPSARQ